MNNFARLGNIKRDEAGVGGTTSLDDVLSRLSEEVSREFESETGRSFVARYAVQYLERRVQACADILDVPFDLASISALVVDEDGDGAYEITLSVDTDYFVERANDADSNTPIVLLRLNPNGTQLYAWPTRKRAVKLTGLCGYSYELEDTTLDASGAVDASQTTITASASASDLVYRGDTLVLDSEQMEVTAVSANGTTLTVVRGINGTTAAAHDSGSDIYVRRYPRDVEQVVAQRVVGLRWDSQGGYDAAVSLTGDQAGARGATTIRGAYARWVTAIRRYKDWSAA